MSYKVGEIYRTGNLPDSTFLYDSYLIITDIVKESIHYDYIIPQSQFYIKPIELFNANHLRLISPVEKELLDL